MANIGWKFPTLSGGAPQQGYTNNDIEVFKGQEVIDNLTREICQNSLDAKNQNNDDPVKVVFELKQINPNIGDVFSGYKECLAGCRKYWGSSMDAKLSRFINDAEKMLSGKEIPTLVVSDYNTMGAEGSHAGRIDSPWKALTESDGVSVKTDNNSAGSYGIGKNAPFACSALSAVFYNTIAEDSESAFVGVARLATLLNSENEPTYRIGKYQLNDDANKRWCPIYPDENNEFRDQFIRNERGTDVIILGFNQVDNWYENVTKAAIRHFFVAIFEKRLMVELKDDNNSRCINSDNIAEYIQNYSDDGEMITTVQLYNAFNSPDCKESLSIITPNDVDVYIKSDSAYKRTIANFRATGMLVGTYLKRIFQHYAAVVIVRGEKLGELLKDTEPPRHNRWDYKLINETEKERRGLAKKSISQIDEQVLDLLKKQFTGSILDTIDAAGVGEYIPDEETGMDETGDGDDILKAKVKIGKVVSDHTIENKTKDSGKMSKGKEITGTVHNHQTNIHPVIPKPILPKYVDPDDDKRDTTKGVARGDGTKTIEITEVSGMRTFPINYSKGLYKVIIVSSKSYEKATFRCFAVGEDGKSDIISMKSALIDGQHISIKENTAGPIKLQENVPVEIYLGFEENEKLKVKVQLMEVK